MDVTHEEPSHGAEETADNIELNLPPALKELLQRLSGSSSSDAKPVEALPDLSEKRFGDFFRDGGEESSTRTEVRLKVLKALGNSQTLRIFDAWCLRDSKLTAAEWEALLVPMRGNPRLEEIYLFTDDFSETDAQNMGPHLRNLVSHAHGLACLNLRFGGPGGVMLAAEVVSGLRANIHHTLKILTVRFGRNGGAAVHVAEMIRLSSQLSDLTLRQVPSLEDVAKEALSAALKGSSNLRSVDIWLGTGEIVDVLAEVYDATRPNPGPLLEDLRLKHLDGLTGETLASLTGLNITEVSIVIDSLRMTDNFNLEQWQRAGRYLLQSPPQRRFRIVFDLGDNDFRLYDHNGEAAEGLEGRLWWEMLGNGLAELSKASQRSPILDIKMSFRSLSDSNIFFFVQKAISDSYVTSLIFMHQDVSSPELKSLVEKLGENTSIRNLDLWTCEGSSKDGWELVFSHLHGNTSIRSLGLRLCRDLNDDDFRVLMELLQVNFTLQTVDIGHTQWKRDGKEPLLEEVLQRNRKQAGYFAILGDAGLPFDGAKAGRVFLCGLPYAGKTQLKVTMLETMDKKSKSESILSTIKRKVGKVGEQILKFRPKRTRGIEVELLCDDEFVTISMWDLAGQAIFKALQNILFPRISQACIFVFVFNPFEGKGKNRSLKRKVDDAFDKELRSWLRFVVSNTQITGHILPQMLVIITHRDKSEKLEGGFDLTLDELEDVVERLKDEFKDVLDLCPSSKNCGDKLIYHINAKAKEEVQSITDLIISCMKDVLNSKSSKVPRACSELVSHLLKSPEEVRRSPLWECEIFYNFCSAKHLLLSKFTWSEEMGRRVLHSVASYMHDVGAICMAPSTIVDSENISIQNPKTQIVVDMNWLTQNFLGELISEGHQFEICPGTTKTCLDDPTKCEDGFLDSEELSNLIEKIMKRTQREGVDRKMVRELLLQLDLCFRIKSKKGVDKFFMPMLFSKKEIATQPLNQLQWRVQPEADPTCKWNHFGFRVQCYDEERTSLTQALFPRYEIHLRKQMEVMGVNDDNFIFSRYHVEIRDNGCIILVEIDESAENHIDILVKVSKDISRDWAMDHVYKHIVKDLITFCASEKGCPGLQMVVSLIRIKCVEQLTPRKFRKSQAVLIEDLKTRFQNDIESKLESTKVDSNSLFSYSHPWPEVTTTSAETQFRLPPGFEPAQTLLSNKDFNKVLRAVGNNHPEYWQNLFGLKQVLDNLNDIELQAFQRLQVPDHRPDVAGESKSEDLATQKQPMPQNLTSLLSRPSFRDRIDVTVGEKMILYHLDKNTHHLEDRIAAGFQQLKDDLRSFKTHMEEMRRQLSDVTCKVDKIIRYEKSKDNHTCPRRPYFTLDDVGTKQKMKAALLFNKAVCLHLMCEARNQPHFVKDQPGLELCFEKEGPIYYAMRKLSVLSLHMVWVLLKIGVQVTAGLGSVIPDISNLETGVSVGISVATVSVVLQDLQQEVDKNLIVLKESGSVQEAWYCLKDYLAPYLCAPDQCAGFFKLHLVRYRNSDDPFAWLCESCVSSGRRNFLLE